MCYKDHFPPNSPVVTQETLVGILFTFQRTTELDSETIHPSYNSDLFIVHGERDVSNQN